MAEISYTWWHAGEKNLVTFGDCFSESLFEDLDSQFNSEVSDGLVNVPDRVLESLTDVENWAENFGRTTGRDHQRAKNKGQIESKSNTCISSPAASAPAPPSPCQDPLPQESKRQLGLLRFNFSMTTVRLIVSVIMRMMLNLMISRAMTKLVKEIRALSERASFKSGYSHRMRIIKKAWVWITRLMTMKLRTMISFGDIKSS